MGNFSDGIWDDGEWISWDWINSQLEEQELHRKYPKADLEVVRVFHDLIDLAREYFDIAGRYLQIWGSWASYMER